MRAFVLLNALPAGNAFAVDPPAFTEADAVGSGAGDMCRVFMVGLQLPPTSSK